MASGAKTGVSKIQPPKGTRDMYPEDALKRRYIEQAWRDASVRCGFEEIHGPTFETTELYAVKSGEGILGELFQAFSGKAEEEVEQVRATGRAPYAMRPEFTPTLARMYAAKGGGFAKPCKWFTGGPYFRAERPQRGRLREFLQWNVDFIGNDESERSSLVANIEVAQCAVALISDLGLTSRDVQLHHADRRYAEAAMRFAGVSDEQLPKWFAWLDRIGKISANDSGTEAFNIGMSRLQLDFLLGFFRNPIGKDGRDAFVKAAPPEHISLLMDMQQKLLSDPRFSTSLGSKAQFDDAVASIAMEEWFKWDSAIVRGLAYYTGMVFEVLADGERAVAGGGRYDKLIELMGGPPTPAVGFAMGDVVVSLLLEDKGLMPQGAELMEAVSRRPASVRPEVFVVGADDAASDATVRRLCADLRRGVEADAYIQSGERKPWSAARYDAGGGGVRPQHARVSYKSTRNLKKLLADGERQFARLTAIVHGDDRVQLKDFDARKDLTPRDVGLSDTHAEFSVDPASPVYVGRAAQRVLG